MADCTAVEFVEQGDQGAAAASVLLARLRPGGRSPTPPGAHVQGAGALEARHQTPAAGAQRQLGDHLHQTGWCDSKYYTPHAYFFS